jgi:uncharacterized glyoxalase superfamily protein PhnB
VALSGRRNWSSGARRCGDIFSEKNAAVEPAIHWAFADDIDATFAQMQSLGANIVDPLEKKPWGLRQFTVQDLDGNLFFTTTDC